MDGAPHQHHHMQQQQRYPPQGGAPMQPMMQNRVVLPLPQAPQPVGGLLLPGPNEPLFLPPGTATLEDDLDKLLVVFLRDGRQLIGYFRSFDQFANMILQHTVERIQIGNEYGDEERGLYIVRGDNVTLMGDLDVEKFNSMGFIKRPYAEMVELHKKRAEAKEKKDKISTRVLAERGFSVDISDFDGM